MRLVVMGARQPVCDVELSAGIPPTNSKYPRSVGFYDDRLVLFIEPHTGFYGSSKPGSEAVVASFLPSTGSVFPAEEHAQQNLSGDPALKK